MQQSLEKLDPYRHKTQHMCYRLSSCFCMPNVAAVRRAISEEIALTQKRT